MSSGQLQRHRSMSSSGQSSKGSKGTGRLATLAEITSTMPSAQTTRDFEPCAATASMFLYAQGNSVVCAHHDTLTIERRFSRHTEEIQLLAVDTVSDRGAGRLVVSYDTGMTAIVWDCMTGDEIARFASYDHLTVAAWMRNGNVAFGNAQGNVILFEPTTSEHISARTIDQIPITALAPAADCRTYAIGFANGSLLIAALQPRFTILHSLTTSRGPSPIVTLAWHASSSRQKSDMLACQTNDGDLRVWSVAKSPSSNESAKVVRVLKRSDNYQTGPNWLGWSKNGRIIQHSEGETSSWDVRTKHVSHESVPTLEHVRGLAIYGPGATLFTLGRNNTAQQFDLNLPAQLVANVQHPTNLLPPSPPVSIEEQKKQDAAVAKSRGELSAVPINIDISESDEDHMSPLARIAREMDVLEQERYEPDRSGALSPVSSRSRTSTNSRSSAGSRQRDQRDYRKPASVVSRQYSEGTTMSIGSTVHTREPSIASSRDSYSMSSISSASHTSGRARTRGSRLRQEVLRSPDDNKVIDLFKFTKARLSDIPYRHPQGMRHGKLTNDDLRTQMLSTIFGWDGEAHALIQDEMNRHPLGSPNRVLLAKWLGDIDTDIMATSSESMTSSDWMLLALSGIGGHASQTKVARAYVQRLLEKGDVHTAATILIGMGDQNDAIEIYVSHKRYMEALILCAHVYPNDWSRQAELIRKWGEWAAQHSQQQLAVRCWTCTGEEPSEPWASPTAQALTFNHLRNASIPELLSPPLSPPGSRGPQRSIAKTSALKLITTFGDKSGKSKFFGLGDDDRTPLGGGATPIAESALSPGGDTAQTALLRPGHRSAYNTPASARTATPGGFSRQRLPSIGEMPTDVVPKRNLEMARLPTPADSGSDKEKSERSERAQERNDLQVAPLLLSSATYAPIARAATASPMMEKPKYKLGAPLPSPSPETFTTLKQDARKRNGSRGRKPDGLQIQWPPMESIITGDYMTSPEGSVASSRYGRGAPSIAGSMNSLSSAGLQSERSYRGGGNASPIVTGRSLDPYISSLESAQHHKDNQRRQTSRERREKTKRERSGSRKPRAREASEDRGRSNTRFIKPAKRSPTSPVPMSPEDLRGLGAVGYGSSIDTSLGGRGRAESRSRQESTKPASRVRRASPEPELKQKSTRSGSRAASRSAPRRAPSPDLRVTTLDATRGRSSGRDGSAMRSPSSPLPMSPQAKFYQDLDDDDEELRQANEERKRFRSRQRSTSRFRERGASTVRDASPDRSRRDRSTSRRPRARESSRSRRDPSPNQQRERSAHYRSVSEQQVGEDVRIKDQRTLKREQAARDLEERRRSLARRPSAPPIVHPEELSSLSPRHFRPSPSPELLRSSAYASPNPSPAPHQAMPPRSQTTSPAASINTGNSYRSQTNASTPQVGLPATPRAMRHPKYDPEGAIPEVPQIPERYDMAPPPARANTNPTNSYNDAFETLGPLPKTTYSSMPRRLPPRSASAPIPEEPLRSPNALPAALPTHPAFHAALPPSTRRKTQDPNNMRAPPMGLSRKINPGEAEPGTLGYESRNIPTYTMVRSEITTGIDETMESSEQSRDHLAIPPPPPPPQPPVIPQLQHLAMPPPPPPAPLYRPGITNTNSVVSGTSSGSGVIEIVMDDEEDSDANIIVVPPPPSHVTSPPNRSISHSRGQSENENSLTGRFTRVTERIRSASRGRNPSSPPLNRTRSPPQENVPYESFQAPWNSSRPGTSNSITGAMGSTERHPREVKAAMHDMEGGMI